MTEITWFKLFHDFADDAKFLRAAEIAGTTVELAQACFARAMCRASSNADRGSLASVDFEEFAWWYKKPVELIRSLFEAFEKIGRMIKDGHLANWAKRQGAAAVKLAKLAANDDTRPVSPGAVRMRRCRAKKKADGRQGELKLVIDGGLSEAASQASPSVTPSVTVTVTSAAEEEGESQRTESVFLKNKGGSFGRDAPLREPAPPTPAEMLIAALRNPETAGLPSPKPAKQSPEIKALKKEQRRAKCFRYIVARFAEEERGKRISGMMGLDPDRNEQWWFVHVDEQMRREGWDDTRDIANDNRWRAVA